MLGEVLRSASQDGHRRSAQIRLPGGVFDDVLVVGGIGHPHDDPVDLSVARRL